MARKSARKKSSPEEIPQLEAMGLTCVNTAGSGMDNISSRGHIIPVS